MSIFVELKRRNVFRVGLAYVLLAWVVLQGADFLLDLAGAPEWVIRSLAIIGLIGLPFALFFAWAFELTPEGIKRESEIDRSQSITPQTGRRLNSTIIGLLLLVIALMVVERVFFAETEVTEGSADISVETITGAATESVSQAVDAPKSVAVLPFVNMSADADNEYFSDGVSEEILNVLARIPDLKVSARTSAFSYKGSDATIAQIARELGVSHVLEGSVRKAGNQVRVTAQLIEADKGFHLWSETYDRELTNIFAIQDDIAQAIAAALKVRLLPATDQPNLTGTTNLQAYELYLQGVNLWHLRTEESLETALKLFEQAIVLDPDFARAHAYFALTLGILPDYGDRTIADVLPKTRAAAEAALALDPDSVEAATSLIQPLLADSPAMLETLIDRGRQLIARNPGFATTHQWHGTNLFKAGFVEEAVASYRTGLELDPRSRIIHQNLGILLVVRGRFDEAQELLENLDDFAPDYWDGVLTRFLLYLISGQREAAEAAGNRLAGILGRARNAVPVYLDLFFVPERKAAAAAEILSFPLGNWWSPDNPALIDDYALPFVLAVAGLQDQALNALRLRLERQMDFYPVALLRSSTLTSDFSCRPEVQAYYAELGLPPLPDC
jgi:TolB-like protein